MAEAEQTTFPAGSQLLNPTKAYPYFQKSWQLGHGIEGLVGTVDEEYDGPPADAWQIVQIAMKIIGNIMIVSWTNTYC